MEASSAATQSQDAATHPLVCVVIVSWNGREHLRRCLAALAGQTFRDFEVVVVDNASEDGSPAMLEVEYPWVRLMRSERNLGFAAANNLAIRGGESRYVATLNNDAMPEPGWLAALVACAEGDAALGAVASKMVFADQPSTINSCGVALDSAGIAWDLWGGYPADAITQRREVFGACAGAALYRRAMLDDVGPMDETFFAYMEDVDLAWRAQHRGWRAMLEPRAGVRHVHSGTLGEGSPRKRYLLARNKVWTVAKNLPAEDVWPWLPVVVVYDVGAAFFGAWRHGDWSSVRGRIVALLQMRTALRHRRAIEEGRRATPRTVRSRYSPLALPWDVPKRYRHLVRFLSSTERVRAVPPTPMQARAAGTSPRSRLGRVVLRGVGAVLRRSGRRRRFGPTESSTLRIVVLRPDHLGDVLLSRPAIERLRVALPGAALTVVAGPWGAPSLQGVDARVVSFSFPGFTRRAKRSPWAPYLALLALAVRLRHERFDAALIFRRDHWWGALAIAVAGIPLRVGVATPKAAPFLTHSVPALEVESWGATSCRVADALLGAIGVPAPDRPFEPTFMPTQSAAREVGIWLDEHDLAGRPFVAVHPDAGAALKSWPAARWSALVDELPADVAVVLTGTPAEAAELASIANRARRPLAMAVDLDWDGLAALYRRAALVVGMDSGPLHLATAVGTPTVRVYGPTDRRVFGPAGSVDRHRTIASTLICAPCGSLDGAPCGYLRHPPCLANVDVHDVAIAACAVLEAGALT